MRILIIAVLALVLAAGGAAANPLESDEINKQLFDQLSTDQVNQFITAINRELNEDIPLLNSDTVKEIATRGVALDWDSLWRSAAAKFFKEMAVNMHLMGKLLFLAVLCVLLQNLQSSFEQSGISVLAYSVCFIFLSVIALTAFYHAITLARDTIGHMVSFMEALLPLMISLLAGVGALTSAALLTPLMLFVISAVSVVVKNVILPLLLITSVLDCVNYLSDKYRLGNLTSLFKQTGMMILGFTMVVFIGIITVQGVAGGVADGITLRTAKYATTTFIPVVGKMFADTVELVMGASLLLKNAVGIFGVIVVAAICALPLIKLLSLVAIVKVTGALVQPMGDDRMGRCLDAMGNNLLLVFGALLTVVLMFFLAITMIIGAGSAAMMLR
ncbi:stage III sporulation protein AE|uniref:Stage III sporulation protein AE n=2 Tax=Dendrosporobacter quercicolus TaxID=146817 RepID=A0A1G9KWP8_9FIRM|nr:stage III sporulation protein AE [Dendrosporobacter quercicolus DSM 1736]SDL54131.1 stage III sporulation protein AE [Dendrosporobacter quercicolus]